MQSSCLLVFYKVQCIRAKVSIIFWRIAMQDNTTKTLYQRQRINQALAEIWDYPLTVVEAPMGYGKTTAVRNFIKESGVEAVWQTVYDPAAPIFWQVFCRLFRQFDPACAGKLSILGVPRDNVLREEATELISGIKFSTRTVLIIDDYHILSSQDADLFFERLAQAAVPNLHIIVISRSFWSERTTELAMKGYCLVIGKKVFELTVDEIAEYCKLCGIRLKPNEIAFLHSYTEGWISAVYLYILSYWQTRCLEQQPASLQELIDKVIYRPLPKEVKEFLSTICIFDRFSLAQAEHMWKKGNAEAILLQLTAENGFITFDYVSQHYSLHNILTNYLRQILDQQNTGTRQLLWKMAGEWYLDVGEYNQAMDCFYQAADFEKLLATIEIAKGAVLARQPKEARIKYFQECPSAIKIRYPLAGIIYAFNLFISNEMELFAQHCKELEGYIQSSLELDDQARLKLMGELEVLKGITSYNNLSAMAKHFKAAWELLKSPSIFVDTTVPWTLGSPSVLYLYYRESGQLEAEVKAISELPCYCRLAGGHGSGGEYIMEAERYYNIGDFDNAEITTYKALSFAQPQRQTSLMLCATLLQIRLALVKGDWNHVLNNLRQSRESLKRKALYSHIYILDMCEGFIFSCLNQPKRVPVWIIHGEFPETLSFPCHAFANMIRDKVLLLNGQYHQLVGIAPQHAAIAGFFPTLLAQIYTYIFEAAALDKLGRRNVALATLQKAIGIAAPDQLIMPFVENSMYIAELLAQLQATGHHQCFIGRIRKTFPPIAAKLQRVEATLSGNSEKQLLTKRETEIAHFVADGLSNQAIGKMLNIETDTVKKALKKIFIKLDVSNRAALTRVFIEKGIA